MEENLISEGLLFMVTELKEKQKQQVTPASREGTINRLDVIEQRILEIRDKSGIPESMIQEILSQIDSIRKGPSGNQKKDLQDIKGMIMASHRCFKERLEVLFPADAQQPEKAEPVSRCDKILNWITLFRQPRFFLFSVGITICLILLTLSFRFVERMQQLRDSDIKYRYLLMKGETEGSDTNLLEISFSRERNNTFIRSLIDSMKDFEYRSRKQTEALERARLLNEQAKQLKERADKLGKP